jgi:GNAT superfamily N-acetyltransferase
MRLTFSLLRDRPNEIPVVARWWCDEWGLPERHTSFDDYVRELATGAADALPLHILAESAGRPIGVATLKIKDAHTAVAGKSRWLSGVYVESSSRGLGVACALCSQIVNLARERAITHIYLETERLDGGLYAKLGWKPIQQLNRDAVDFLVMLNQLVDVPG